MVVAPFFFPRWRSSRFLARGRASISPQPLRSEDRPAGRVRGDAPWRGHGGADHERIGHPMWRLVRVVRLSADSGRLLAVRRRLSAVRRRGDNGRAEALRVLGRARSPVLRRGRQPHAGEGDPGAHANRIRFAFGRNLARVDRQRRVGCGWPNYVYAALGASWGTPTFRRDGPDSFGFGGNGHIRDPRRCAVLCRAQRQAADLTQTSDQNAGGAMYAFCTRFVRGRPRFYSSCSAAIRTKRWGDVRGCARDVRGVSCFFGGFRGVAFPRAPAAFGSLCVFFCAPFLTSFVWVARWRRRSWRLRWRRRRSECARAVGKWSQKASTYGRMGDRLSAVLATA